MPIRFQTARILPKRAKAHIWIVTTEAIADDIDQIDPQHLQNANFQGKQDQVFSWPHQDRLGVLLGVGSQSELTTSKLRRAGGIIGRKFKDQTWLGIEMLGVTLEESARRQALVEGIALGSYQFLVHKSAIRTIKLNRVDVVGQAGSAGQAALDMGKTIANAQMLARDFINEPGGTLTAPEFAERAATIAGQCGLEVKVWDETDIAQGGLGGLLGVNRGSTLPPRLVELTYTPDQEAHGTLTLVGKGIVFDAGGLSIKNSQGMMTMKYDMSGGAAVIAAMTALPQLSPRAKIKAFVPMTDNMLGGDATRPGDVLTIRNGKTIEVLNTDAEGRLILADALALASEEQPDAIIDLATLTGACAIALGAKIAGLMGNSKNWISVVQAAADTADERVWHLPLPADYKQQFESAVADIQNIGEPRGGALTAGLILQEFVDSHIAWAHLDIAGPAWSDNDDADITKGGTGFGVRLLIELARNFKPLAHS